MHSSATHTAKELIGTSIKLLRKERNMTQQEFADLLNVDKQYVWKLENGKKNLTMNYLDKIIAALKCKHEDFFINNTR